MASENKSEKPTPRKRQKAREQGRLARSPEVGSALAMSVTVLVLASQAQNGIATWRAILRWSLAAGNSTPRAGWGILAAHEVAMSWIYPVLAGSLTAALAGSLVQGGLVFAPTLLKPSLERISPIARMKKLMSVASLTSLGKSLLPTSAMVYVALSVLRRDWLVLTGSGGLSARPYATVMASRIFEIAWKCSLVLMVWAAIDFFVMRQKFEGDLRMTPQELREESKESEGNPQVKSRIRRLQRQVRRKRMLQDTARAAVVITNPTEYAIALEYREGLPAPLVVAKGRNLVAVQIKHAARWAGVPMIENVPLAHSLYRTAEVGQFIPAKLYAAVAEVLAFILRAQARAAVAGGR